MARTPAKIPTEAAEAWARGDELAAEKLSGLRSRQLRNRLGPPGRGAVAPASATAPAALPSPPTQKLVKVPPRARAQSPAIPSPPAPPPSEPEPTVEQIEALDTREEALAILRDIRSKMRLADDVRYGSLAEKALSAINRIEQIDRRRPAPPAPDEVTRRLVEVRDRAIERFGILAREAVQKGATS